MARDPNFEIATPADAGEMTRIYAPYVTGTAISFEEIPPSHEEMVVKIARVLETHPWLVARIDGSIAGYAYASAHRDRAAYRWSVDVSVYVDSKYHRQGIGRELYVRLFEILRSQNYFNAYAGITLPNEASVGLHESLGFRPVGRYENVGYKFGRWHDTGWWQLRLRRGEAEPPEPKTFHEWLANGQTSSSLPA